MLNGNFPLDLATRYHFKKHLKLFAFKYEEDENGIKLDLKLFPMYLLPNDECDSSFTHFHATEHFCCRGVEVLTHWVIVYTRV